MTSGRKKPRDVKPIDVERSSWASGAVAMIALLTVAVASLYQQGRRLEETDPSSPPTLGGVLTSAAGFRADAWHLPDDELLGFVEIPAGSFLMGSDPTIDPLAFDIERWSAGEPRGRVDLPTFFIGRFEVTVEQFRAFVSATGHVVDSLTLRGQPTHPVAAVSWPDALAYTNWLHGALRGWPDAPPRLAGLLAEGWRIGLPTEAEWEKAARSDDGRIFPWGDESRPDRANYAGTGVASVGGIDCPECPYGLADMSGNVWEWTRSPYQAYPYDPSDDPEDLEVDALWVMRGGSFADGEQNVRAAVRGGADPGARRAFIGFRIAISPPHP